MKKISISFLLSALVFFSFSTSAFANVALKNGNFFVAYVDAIYPGGFEPKIERVYNSKSVYRGMFGWGWGTEYEVGMTVLPDGSVVVNEFGGGSENRFVPVKQKPSDLKDSVEKIVQVAKSTGYLTRADQLKQYHDKLMVDRGFMVQEWDRFKAAGKLQARNIPDGTQLISTQFSYQYITKVKDGYLRNSESGKVEKYDSSGKLTTITDRNSNSITLGYSKDGRLEKITDSLNRKMIFSFDTKGRVEKIVGEGGRSAGYAYNDLDELTTSKDFDGNTYTYKFSADKRHNLTEIGYSDKTNLQVSYYGRDQHENVKTVKERDGTVTEYKYQGDRMKPGTVFSVTVINKDKEGKVVTQSKYDYTFKVKADGEEYTQKMVAVVDGEKTETSYNEMGLPLSIARGKDVSRFEYDIKGRVTKKSTPNEVTELTYDPKANKVSKVLKYPPSKQAQKSVYEFQYDGKANLVSAKSSAGKGVQLFYDNGGRIKTLVDQSKRRLDFKYNENSKPVEISDPQLGAITVTYGNAGEIRKVESSAGRKIALQVTSAFQNLMEIIRPAGVSLSL